MRSTLSTFSVAILLAIAPLGYGENQPAKDDREALIEDIRSAVSGNNREEAQTLLESIGKLLSETPAGVQERLATASLVTENQDEGYRRWQELSGQAEKLMQAADYDRARMKYESALGQAQETFGEEHWFAISSIRDIGLAYRQMGDAQLADTYYSLAADIAGKALGQSHPQTLEIESMRAELFAAAGQFEASLQMLGTITQRFEESLGSSHKLTLDSRLDRVVTLEVSGRYDQAIEQLSSLCEDYEQGFSPYHQETFRCLDYLAGLHRNIGSLTEAERIRVAMSDAMSSSLSGVSESALANLMQLADIHGEQGDRLAARELLSSLILTARQIGAIDLSYTGKAYLARILGYEGQLDGAIEVSEDVVKYGASAWADRPVQYYNVLLELGSLYQRKSRFAEAEKLFEDAMTELLQVAGDQHPTTLVAMNNLGALYEQLGLYDDAEPLLKQTLEAMGRSFGEDHPQTARIRNNLALLHESQGNFREAEPLYHNSYQNIVQIYGEAHPNALAIQNNLAFLYMMMEKYPEAAETFTRVVASSSEVLGAEHQDTLKSLNNLGRVFQKQGMLEEAESKVLSALQSRRSVLGERHVDTIRSLVDIGSIYLDQGRLEEAASHLSDALKIAEAEIGEQHPYTFDALNLLAKALEARGDLSAAVELRSTGLARRSVFLDRMLWVAGENAREGYIRLHRPELDAYLSLLSRIDDPLRGKKVIDASLQRKGLLLKITSEIEQIAQMSIDPRLQEIAGRLEASRRDLASLTLSGPTAETRGRHAEALYVLEQRVNELQGELGRASVRYRSSIQGASVETLAQSLADNTSLVDLLNYEEGGEKKLMAGVMTKTDGDVSFDLVTFENRIAMEESVIEYRSIIQDDLADDDEIMESGQIAYDLVWGPIADATNHQPYVYLIPDGVLNILPFNALVDEDEQYLIETTDLHLLTSGRDLLPNDYELARGEYIVLAGPDYDSEKVVTAGELAAAAGRRSSALKLGIRGAGNGLRGLSFEPLPGAAEEGRIITDQVTSREQKSEVFFGEDAQEQVLSSFTETPEILHMATHGFFLEADDTLRKRLLKMQRSLDVQVPPPGDNPLLRAGLAFAGINTNAQFLGDIDTINDGVLTALEVLGLDLSGTRLVVLSACETGLGEIHEGEGVYGLRRSFQEAGVAEVVSSLWEVSDAGTQALMTDFYDRILDGVPARVALRETQLELIDSPEWGYPYIWSAFMIVGSYESAGMAIN